MTQQPAKITVTAQAQLIDGTVTYWARAEYDVVPHGPDNYFFQPTKVELLSEVDEDIGTLAKGLACSFFPRPPKGVKNHLQLDEVIWRMENVHGEGRTEFTPEGAQKVKAYVKRNSARLFPEPSTPYHYLPSPSPN